MWEAELMALGFKRSGRGACWICRGRYGLPSGAHLSLFDPDRALTHGAKRRRSRRPVRVDAFHVTWEIGDQNVHVYYRAQRADAWEAEGHTPSADIAALGVEPRELLARSDACARRLLVALRPEGFVLEARTS